jgi:hypothetical protein
MRTQLITTKSNDIAIDMDIMRKHCMASDPSAMDLLEFYVRWATRDIEKYIRTPILQRECEYVISNTAVEYNTNKHGYFMLSSAVWPISSMPNLINLPFLVQTLNSVTVIGWDGTPVVLDPTQYIFDNTVKPARILFLFFPVYAWQHIVFNITAGLADTTDDLDDDVVGAIMLAATYRRDHRGDENSGDAILDSGAQSALSAYKTYSTGYMYD